MMMKNMMKKKIAAVLAVIATVGLVALSAHPQNPGVVMQMEVKQGTAAPVTITTLVAGRNLRMEMPPTSASGRSGQIIFRGDRREMIVVNHDEKSYLVIDDAAVKQLASQLGGMMAEMEKALANVPESQRAMVQEMMRKKGFGAPAGARPRPTLRPTNAKATHGTYATRKHEVVTGNRVVRELWVTPWSNIEGHEEVRPAFEAMAAFSKGLTDALANSPIGAMANLDSNDYAFVNELDGFPVLTRELDQNNQPETETTLKSSTRKTLAAADFEPPAGYRQQQLPGAR